MIQTVLCISPQASEVFLGWFYTYFPKLQLYIFGSFGTVGSPVNFKYSSVGWRNTWLHSNVGHTAGSVSFKRVCCFVPHLPEFRDLWARCSSSVQGALRWTKQSFEMYFRLPDLSLSLLRCLMAHSALHTWHEWHASDDTITRCLCTAFVRMMSNMIHSRII